MTSGKRGFALVWICFVLVLLGVVTGTAFFTALQAERAGRHAADGLTVRLLAERAAADAFAGWRELGLGRLALGGSMQWSDATTSTAVTRWGLAATVVEASAAAGLLAHREVWLGEPAVPDLPLRAVLTVRPLGAQLESLLSGPVAMPLGWSCDLPTPVQTLTPQYYVSDATLDSAIGGWSAWAAWAGAAQGTVDSVTVAFARGDTVLRDSLTGVLVASGRLRLDSGAAVTGIVLAQNEIEISSWVEVTGVLVAPKVSLGGAVDAIAFSASPCTARVVLASRVPLRPVPGVGRVAIQ